MQSRRFHEEGNAAYMIRNMLMANTAAMLSETLTIPLDTAKVRLQIQKVEPGQEPKYKGIFQTMGRVTADEGPLALWSGLTPGLQRQFINAGLRVGLYVPIRDMICGPLKPGENPTLFQKILAGLASGAIGIAVANPTDVVKIRMQAQGRLPPEQRPYSGSMDCYKKIISEKGVPGLWVGVGPNMARNAIINSAELASYDQFKQIAVQKLGMDPTAKTTHISCAFGAGFVAVCFGSPVDVLKTRLMNATPGQKTGAFNVIGEMLRNEGPKAFYKGFTVNFLRIGSWNVGLFLFLEQIKNHMDKKIDEQAARLGLDKK